MTRRHWLIRVLLIVAATMGWGHLPALAGTGSIHVSNVWVSANDKLGADVPLLMTIRNDAADDDRLLRVRCPFVNFSERHIVDRGEGAPAMRSIKSIPIPARTTVELKADGYHVMLLQTRQKLVEGAQLTCSVIFQNGGVVETEVQVRSLP
ncbi:MAG: copper chaperone PCu(A)C [Xanthobacteraceae bacterium]